MIYVEESWAKYRNEQSAYGYEYTPGDEHIYRDAWRAALIQAAKLCADISGNVKDFNDERRRGAGQCEAAIRNLLKGK